MSRIGKSFAVASASLALFGLGRVIFNLVGLRVFGPEVVGSLNVAMSTWSLIAVAIATVPSFVISKYVSEFVASSERVRAARMLAFCLLTTLVLLLVPVVVSVVIRPRTAGWPWPLYGVAFGMYLLCRAACFAHQRIRTAFEGELVAFVVFGITLSVGPALTRQAATA